MKKYKTIAFLSVASVGLALLFSLGGHAAIEATSGDKFCVSCHEWMDPMAEAYSKDIHGGNNSLGAKAKCADCHLPHDSLVGYLWQKGKNGFTEGAHMLLNDPKSKDWQANRQRRDEYVFDTGCLKCHTTVMDIKSDNQVVGKMHELYVKYQNTSNAIQCSSCHVNVGHKGLGKVLYDRNHEPIGEWEDKVFSK
ncbi:cytochrome c3 family protein [Wolinella succinogenes]|uniref:cytochrome c3 family protein n=1 Tax=Wolinella succinogenes TaxID=844 RepID=UPI002FCBC897